MHRQTNRPTTQLKQHQVTTHALQDKVWCFSKRFKYYNNHAKILQRKFYLHIDMWDILKQRVLTIQKLQTIVMKHAQSFSLTYK